MSRHVNNNNMHENIVIMLFSHALILHQSCSRTVVLGFQSFANIFEINSL